MSRFKNVHWAAPTAMVGAFLTGALLSLGHHLFYRSLNRQPLPTASYRIAGHSLSGQQVNILIGNAFAFLVKVFLAIAVSTAYVQLFWTAAKSAKKSPTIKELDWAAACLDNVFGLFNFKLGWKHPLLMLLAVCYWGISIAMLFPPGALSVSYAPVAPAEIPPIPQLNFTNTDSFYSAVATAPTKSTLLLTINTGQVVQQVVKPVMILGEILPIAPPTPNSFWTLAFWGPALQCNDAGETERDKILINIWNSLDSNISVASTLLSWVPWSSLDFANANRSVSDWDPEFPLSNRYLPYIFNYTGASSAPFSGGGVYPVQGPSGFPVPNDGPASLWVAVMPNMSKVSSFFTPGGRTTVYSQDGFHFFRAVQSLNESLAQSSYWTPNQVFNNATIVRCDLVNASYSVSFNYSTSRQELGVSVNTTSPSSYPLQSQSTVHSYLGLMASFNQMLLGSIDSYGSLDGATGGPASPVMETIIGDTVELAFIKKLQGTPQHGKVGYLKSTLEKSFQNLTVSLFAKSDFHANYSSPQFRPAKNTNFVTYQNIYNYNSTTLFISYGISILIVLFIITLGLFVIATNTESYSNNFSTILRVSRTAELSVDVDDKDGGRDPLPKYLQSATLDLGGINATAAKEEVESSDSPPEEQRLVPVTRIVPRTLRPKSLPL